LRKGDPAVGHLLHDILIGGNLKLGLIELPV